MGKKGKIDNVLNIISCPTCVTYILQNILVSFTTFRQLNYKGNNNFFFSFCFFSFGFGGSEKGQPAFIIIVLHFSNHWAAKFLYNLLVTLAFIYFYFYPRLNMIFSGFLYPSLLFWHLSVVTHNKANSNKYVDPLVHA